MARNSITKLIIRRPGDWLRVSMASLLLMMAVPGWAYGTGLCNVNGACSVYAYVEHGSSYLLSDSQPIGAHPNMAHFTYVAGLWRAWHDGDNFSNPQSRAPDNFSVQWGPTSGTPLAGDWTGNGYDGFAVATELSHIPNKTFVLLGNISFAKNSAPTIQSAGYYLIPVVGGTPIVGDWDGDGIDSVGIYKDGVFTLANNSAPTQWFEMDFTYFLPTDPVEAAAVKGITWPWQGDGIDYVGMSLPAQGQIMAVSGHIPGYVYGDDFSFMYMKIANPGTFDPGMTPAVLPGPTPGSQALTWLAHLNYCWPFEGGAPCDPPYPNSDGGAVRPGDMANWFP